MTPQLCTFWLKSMVTLSISMTGINLSKQLFCTQGSKGSTGQSSHHHQRKERMLMNLKTRVKHLFKHGSAGQLQSSRLQGCSGCLAKDVLIMCREWHLVCSLLKRLGCFYSSQEAP